MEASLKHKHWFPHPADLRNDRRMKRAMKDLPGGVGYGLIVLMLEVLRNEPEFQYPLNDIDLLASEFDVSMPILKTVITNYGFFEFFTTSDGDMFISPTLNELMIPYLEKVKKNKIAGKISAQKRKKKEEEQLRLLSQLSSSQHLLDICETDDKHNREEQYNKTEGYKKKSLFTDFSTFKEYILSNYREKIVCYGPSYFAQSTAILVTGQEYLRNMHTKKDLSVGDALKVWEWMFENQDMLCEVQ